MRRLVGLLALSVAFADGARAEVDGRLSLSGLLLRESQEVQGDAPSDASPVMLAYAELRGVLAGRRLAGGLEFKLDFRLRLTSDFTPRDDVLGSLPIAARGYAGGREYDLREAWVGRRGESLDFAAGRLFVREADALLVDGLRLTWRFTRAWRASVYGGAYPDPFARSLPEDYVAANALAGAAGASAAYDYERVWGSASVNGIFFGGSDDGGPISPAAPVGTPQTERTRVYLTWTNYVRIARWFDLFHDLVVDATGAAGAQLTRADALASLHLGRFHAALGYGHLSALAAEMYLARLLGDRSHYLPGTVENNLIVQRTARDEGRANANVQAVGQLRIYADARVRTRALVEPAADPAFSSVASRLAWDLTVGARSSGDLAGLRVGAAFTYLLDHRAETKLVSVDLGRDFGGERLSIDLGLIWEGIRDLGAGATACDPARPLDPGCFGRTTGAVYQAGITVAGRPSPRWLLLADYRAVISNADAATSIVSHVAYVRVEARFGP